MSRVQDLIGVLKGIQNVAQAGIQLQKTNIEVIWANSSIRAIRDSFSNNKNDNSINVNDFVKIATDGAERVSTVMQSITKFTQYSATNLNKKDEDSLKKRDSRQVNEQFYEYEITLSEKDKALLNKLDMEHEKKIKDTTEEIVPKEETIKVEQHLRTKPHSKARQNLNLNAREKTVPSSRLGRMASFGSLAAGLGIGTLAEFARRTFGVSNSTELSSLFLTPANTDRIVNTLCKVRGAALKIGQILSIQDESIVSPHIAQAFERVRRSADFMPSWQVEKVLKAELGDDWRSYFHEFDMKPFAAASIGQVHWGKMVDGQEVAIKIQYPGVAKGIESDIDNLVGIMKVWNMFPEGMFLDNLIVVAKRELAWEVDYIREAECTRIFKKLLQPYPQYYVPKVIDNLSKKEIFTTEFMDALSVDQCFDMSADIRKDIATKVMNLCLMEILEFQYMQTDPNWANFFYDKNTKTLILLDFGASRSYSKPFMDVYVRIIKAASDGDKDTVLKCSRELGFLTGYESKIMESAHVDATMILGEIFHHKGEFDFSKQNTTKQIQQLVPTMLAHRLCPPPEEIYSLHRKLSGVFLLCSKLKVAINCRDMFLEKYHKYKFD